MALPPFVYNDYFHLDFVGAGVQTQDLGLRLVLSRLHLIISLQFIGRQPSSNHQWNTLLRLRICLRIFKDRLFVAFASRIETNIPRFSTFLAQTGYSGQIRTL